MAAGYQYVLELVDKLSGPAKTAASETARLTSKLEAEHAAVAKLEKQIENLNKADTVDIGLMKRKQSELASMKRALGGTGEQLRKLAAEEEKAAKASAAAAKEASSLSSAWAAAGPYLAAAAAVLAVMGAAVIGFAMWGGKMALDASQFKRQTLSALESATGTAEAARDAFAIIRKASDEIGISEAKAQKLGLSLLDAGVSQAALADSIKAIATLEKVRGEETAKKVEEAIRKSAAAGKFKLEGEALAGSGLSQADVVAELAARMKTSTAAVEAQLKAGTIKANDGIAALNAVLTKKLGGNAKGLQSLEGATEKFREKISRLFEDVNVGPFLELVEQVSALFDTSTVSGEALRFLMTSVFDGLFATAKAAFPYIKVVLLELVIVALKLYIAAKPIVAVVKDLFASAGDGDTFATVLRTIVNVVAVLAVAFVVVVGAILAFNLAASAAFYAVIYYATMASLWIQEKLAAAWNFVASLFTVEGATGIATALIDGLVNGITGGAGRVVDALKGVGTGAIKGVKDVLGIASPSKVAQGLADNFTSSFADTAEAGAPEAQGAMAAAVAPPPAAAPASSGGGASVVISEGAIVIHAGGANAAEIAELLPGKLAELFESLGLQLGGAVSAGGGAL